MSLSGHVFLFGAGYSARAFARSARGGGLRFSGTTRSPDGFARLEQAGIAPLLFGERRLSVDTRERLGEATHLVVSVAPDERGDPVLDAAAEAIRSAPRLRWIGYLSTVGVYGDHGRAWVDEGSECRPVSRRSVQRLAAEESWRRFAADAGRPLAIMRLSGIYGPGRNAFVNLENDTARRLVKPGQVFNRIHVEDIASALAHLAAAEAGGVFNVTDDVPAPPQDVVSHAATLMCVAPPPEQDFETAELSPMARSFYGENKRVSNAKLKATGYRFRFPDYRAALEAMWTAGHWRGEGAADARSPMGA